MPDIDDGDPAEDDLILADLMRGLLARSSGLSITIWSGDQRPVVTFPEVTLTLPPNVYAAVDRFYSQDRRRMLDELREPWQKP